MLLMLLAGDCALRIADMNHSSDIVSPKLWTSHSSLNIGPGLTSRPHCNPALITPTAPLHTRSSPCQATPHPQEMLCSLLPQCLWLSYSWPGLHSLLLTHGSPYSLHLPISNATSSGCPAGPPLARTKDSSLSSQLGPYFILLCVVAVLVTGLWIP